MQWAKRLSQISNMTDRMSDSIRERQYGQYCHYSSQLSHKFTVFDNSHKNSQPLINVTICHNYHNCLHFSKFSHLSQFSCIGHSCQNWSKLSQLFAIVNVWTNLDKFDQVGTSLDIDREGKGGFCKFRQTLTAL